MMKNNWHVKKSIITMICIFTMQQNAMGFFQDAALGVRPAGMGEAFVATADDANTVLFNAAGLAGMQSWELAGMYADLFNNLKPRLYDGSFDQLNYNFAVLAIPLSRTFGTLGFSWTQFNSTFYKENTWLASYGLHCLGPGLLDAGVTIKMLQWTAGRGELGKNGVTADIGLLSRPWQGFSLGVSAENVLPAHMGLEGNETVPVILRAGAAFEKKWYKSAMDSLQVSLEWEQREYFNNFKVGLETWFFRHFLGIRTGVNVDAFSGGLSFLLAGGSSPLEAQVDYAFTYPFQVFNTYGSHRVGMTFRWGNGQRPAPDDDATKADTPQNWYAEALKAYHLQAWEESLAWWEKIMQAEPGDTVALRYRDEVLDRLQAGKSQTPAGVQNPVRLAGMSGLGLASGRMQVEIQGIRSLAADAEPETGDEAGEHAVWAQEHFARKEYLRTLEEWEMALSLDPARAEDRAQMSKLIQYIRSHIEEPFQQGLDAFNRKDYLTALNSFRLVQKVEPRHSLAVFYLEQTRSILVDRMDSLYSAAEKNLRLGRYREAYFGFREILQISPGYREAGKKAQLAKKHLQVAKRGKNNYQQVLNQLTQARIDEAVSILAPLVREQRQDQKLLALFNRAVELQARALDHYRKGLAYYQEKDFEPSIGESKTSLEINIQSQAREVLVKAYLEKGVQAYRRNALQEALEAWTRALEQEPENPLIKQYVRRVTNKIEFIRKEFGEEQKKP